MDESKDSKGNLIVEDAGVQDLKRRKKINLTTESGPERKFGAFNSGGDEKIRHRLQGIYDPISASNVIAGNLVSSENILHKSIRILWIVLIVFSVVMIILSAAQTSLITDLSEKREEEKDDKDENQSIRNWIKRLGMPLVGISVGFGVAALFIMMISKVARNRVADISDLTNANTLYFLNKSITSCISHHTKDSDYRSQFVNLADRSFINNIPFRKIPSVNQAKQASYWIKIFAPIVFLLCLSIAGISMYTVFEDENVDTKVGLVGVLFTVILAILSAFLVYHIKQLNDAPSKHIQWVTEQMNTETLKDLLNLCPNDDSTNRLHKRAKENLDKFKNAVEGKIKEYDPSKVNEGEKEVQNETGSGNNVSGYQTRGPESVFNERSGGGGIGAPPTQSTQSSRPAGRVRRHRRL